MSKKLHDFKYLVPLALSIACTSAPEGGPIDAEPGTAPAEDTSNPHGTGNAIDDGPSGGDGPDAQVSCSLEYGQLTEERFALEAKTPLGVGAEVVAPWTLEGSTELMRFDATTSSHASAGPLTFSLEPLEALYASGKAAADICKPYQVLSIWTHVTLDLDGAVYEGNGRMEVRPAGTISGSDEAVARSGELSLLELSCTSGCPDADSLLFTANADDSGRTLGFITRGSDELSFRVP